MSDKKNEINLAIHGIRNQLNQISMHTEVAKMLVEQQGDTAKVIQSLQVVLEACEQCDTRLNAFKRHDT